MLGRKYDNQTCSIAGSLEVVGERWTLLIIRDAFLGVRRFEDFHRRLEIARNVLTARLETLLDTGILRRVQYRDRPARYEYRLTAKGLDLWPVIVALLNWGDRYVYPDAAPILLFHKDCGGAINDRRICDRCGSALGPRDVSVRPGPGARQRLPYASVPLPKA